MVLLYSCTIIMRYILLYYNNEVWRSVNWEICILLYLSLWHQELKLRAKIASYDIEKFLSHFILVYDTKSWNRELKLRAMTQSMKSWLMLYHRVWPLWGTVGRYITNVLIYVYIHISKPITLSLPTERPSRCILQYTSALSVLRVQYRELGNFYIEGIEGMTQTTKSWLMTSRNAKWCTGIGVQYNSTDSNFILRV